MSDTNSCSDDDGSNSDEETYHSGDDDKKIGKRRKKRFEKPRIVDSMVEFSLGPVNPHLTCRLCEGYFRDPITITECLHTFCKSCLYYAFSAGFRKCPSCDVDLGVDPFKSTLPDRTLQQLVDKVLFTDLREKDEELEKEFYAEKGIALKPEYIKQESKRRRRSLKKSPIAAASAAVVPDHNNLSSSSTLTVKNKQQQEEEIEFYMVPAKLEDDSKFLMPPMELNLLSTSSKIKIFNLKRFVLLQLNLSPSSSIDIMCKGIIVGNELSLTFIKRTIWMNENEILLLSYRYADENH